MCDALGSDHFCENVNTELTTAPFFKQISFDEYIFGFVCGKRIINALGYVDFTTFMNNHDAAAALAWTVCCVPLFCFHLWPNAYVDFPVCKHHTRGPFFFFFFLFRRGGNLSTESNAVVKIYISRRCRRRARLLRFWPSRSNSK